MAVAFCLCCVLLVTSVASLPTKTFNQKQDGSLNIHAQLENVIVVLVPTSGISLIDPAAKSRPNKNSLLHLMGKTSQNIDKAPADNRVGEDVEEKSNDSSSQSKNDDTSSSTISESNNIQSSALESKNSVESPVLILESVNSQVYPIVIPTSEDDKGKPVSATESKINYSPSSVSENKLISSPLSSGSDSENLDFSSITITKSESDGVSPTKVLESENQEQSTNPHSLEAAPLVPESEQDDQSSPSVVKAGSVASPTSATSDSENEPSSVLKTNTSESSIIPKPEISDKSSPVSKLPDSFDKLKISNEFTTSNSESKLSESSSSSILGTVTKITKTSCLTNQINAASQPLLINTSRENEAPSDSEPSGMISESNSKFEKGEGENTGSLASVNKISVVLIGSADPSKNTNSPDSTESKLPDPLLLVPAVKPKNELPEVVVAESPSVSLKNDHTRERTIFWNK